MVATVQWAPPSKYPFFFISPPTLTNVSNECQLSVRPPEWRIHSLKGIRRNEPGDSTVCGAKRIVAGVSRVLGFPGTSHSWAVPRPHHAHLSVVSGTNGPGNGELELRCREHRHHRHRQRITIIHINVNVYDRRRGLAGYPFGTVLTLRAYAFSGLRVRSYAKCALL